MNPSSRRTNQILEKERENLYLLVAGGNTQTNQCSDGFFVLNLRTLVWVCLETNIGIEPFWGSTAQTLLRPDGREVMVLFSGMFDSGEIIERYYLIDPSKVCTSGRHHLHTEAYDLPRHFSGRRRASSAAVWDHYMIIFGGRNNQSEFFNDVWVFCLLTNGWTPLAASTPKELVQQYWHVAATPQLPNQVEQLDEISRVMMVRYEAELEVYEEKYTEALQYRWLSFIRAEFLKEDDQAVENGQMLPLEVLQNLVLAAVKNKMNDPNHTLPMPAATAEEFVASYQYLPAHLKREVKGKRHFHYSPVLPRTGSCAAFDPIRGIFFVYGGFFLAGFTRQATYMDLHAYYVRQHTWRSVCFSRQPYYHRDLENSPTQYSDLVKYLYSRPLTGENPYGGYIGEAKTDGAPSSLVGYLRRHLAPNQPKTEGRRTVAVCV
ncbi:hypothetical protein AGDE_16303 [Angomonas deanei]|uniref:Kelch motif/Galactose oxidase, central domain containing protein, putative n=1 Tax=Angomonas deanei TaxID=59799 RepID=A0A7G2CSE5_9TRYP|nr:hypothetical protein AGDE_16303 [Angomonas deanei]CAD2221904.1 Kelch motif/Galactose oxidase, central domain containing protein, putative [Angomonas deanei]|eukprot:EPY17341.1 hypothetical protein AGDE_16303 [Angomonas deanei]